MKKYLYWYSQSQCLFVVIYQVYNKVNVQVHYWCLYCWQLYSMHVNNDNEPHVLLMTESWMVKDEDYSDYGGRSREQISEPWVKCIVIWDTGNDMISSSKAETHSISSVRHLKLNF